jgi:hypothetical protein
MPAEYGILLKTLIATRHYMFDYLVLTLYNARYLCDQVVFVLAYGNTP